MTADTASTPNGKEVLRRLANESALIVWEADPDGRCTFLNPQSMVGLTSPGEVNIFDWAELIHPEDLARTVATIRSAREQGDEYTVEYRVVRSDGTVRWILGASTPRHDAQGKLMGYLGSIVDVSENHEARARLTRSEAEHRLMTEGARDMISHSDAKNCYVYASPSHKDTLGYDPEEIIGTHLYDYIHPDDLEASAPQPGQRRGLATIRFRHKNGSWVWLAASTRTIRDPQTGEKVGIVSVARDITAQLTAQRELARREERFRSLTSLSSDWYWELDPDGRFTFCSEGVLNRLHVDPASLLGTTVHEHVVDKHSPGFISCIESIAARRPFHDLIYPAQSPSHPGLIRYLRVSGEPCFEDGTYIGFRGVTRDVTREVKTASTLERLATFDNLTGLPNRVLLEKRLKQRIENRPSKNAQAVLFIDLDDFKEVNDSLGHAAGDELLREIAERLQRCVRPDDIVARLGGDEFVLIAECTHTTSSAAAIAQKVCAALDEPVMIGSHEVRAGASVGISMYPHDGTTSEILLQNADTALYRAKAAGGKTYRFFTSEMGIASRQRLMLQTALRHALERDEFEVLYQPRVNLQTLEMTGMEALLRWTHPQMGAISPVQFIALAEETGLIDEIGDWVLRRATAQTQNWIERFQRPLRISVNLSARQLRSKRLLRSVSEALQSSGLAPGLLELELTETGLMEDPELAAQLLQTLRGMGLNLSVDDFGTGYSSLAYLCRFPLDKLKLDRSFLLQKQINGVTQWKLAEAIINLAHTLNLSVVAEGVEAADHLEFLRKTSCDEIQGFCISRPIPAAEFELLLQKGQRALPVHHASS